MCHSLDYWTYPFYDYSVMAINEKVTPIMATFDKRLGVLFAEGLSFLKNVPEDEDLTPLDRFYETVSTGPGYTIMGTPLSEQKSVWVLPRTL